MRSLWLQVAAVTAINLKSIAQRRWLSLSTVIAIALVVIVLLAFLAMANGFQRTIAGSGADDIAIVLRAGSQAEINSTVSRDQVRLIEDGPGIARGGDGKPLISPELYLVVDGIKRSTKTKANLPLRGIGEQGSALRKGVTITAGRMFNRGSNEVVVGKALLREFEGFDLGSTVSFGATRWTVVGVFEAGGSVFESEIWADLNVVQSLFNRNNIVQTVRARLTGPAALERAQELQRQRSAAEARRQIRGGLLRRTGLADLRPDSETRLAAGDRDGAGRDRRRAQHDVFVGRRARDRDRDAARHRLRRLPRLCRNARRIAAARRHRRAVGRRRDLSDLRRRHAPRRSAATSRRWCSTSSSVPG